MACELNYKTVRPLTSLEPTVYVDPCNPCPPKVCKVATPCPKPCKVATPCKKVCFEETIIDECGNATVVAYTNGSRMGNWWSVLLVFIIVFIVAWFLLYSLRPTAVLNTDANGVVILPPTVNGGKVVVFAIVIALIFCLLVWAFRNSFKY